MSNKDEEEQDQELGKQAIRMANAVVLPMVIRSAIELKVIDILFEGAFLSPSEIASRIPTTNPDAPVILDRMLRLLASHDVLKCSVRTGDNGQVERLYSAGPICKFFVNNEEGGSHGPMFSLLYDRVFMESWYHINDVVLEGGMPFERAYGMTAFEYPKRDQKFNRIFNRAMSSNCTMIMNKVLQVYKGFEGLNILVDVGGGIGASLNMITSKYPQIKGINFDLPHVIADAPPYSGVEHVKGDMFVSVPKGDAIFMKWILHDWNDEHCLTLLKNCWEALPSSGKVIIVESILPVVPENNVSSQIVFEEDIGMFVVNPGGKERTQKDFEALAINTGFSGSEVICSAYGTWVMEFHKSVDA